MELLLCGVLSAGSASAQPGSKVTEVARGVYTIEHQARGPVSGNSTVIIGERQVLVVDTSFRPSVAQQDIASIRSWTDKPVAFIVNTHFHNDHNIGNRAYMDAFPAVTIIACSETKNAMDIFGPTIGARFDKETIPYQKMLETGKAPDGSPLTDDEKKQVEQLLSRRDSVSREFHELRFQSATLTFEHAMKIDLGSREVEIKFLGRGNTAGDAVVYLPKEKIAIVGDLVVYPIPYIFDGYPSEWIRTLENVMHLDAAVIIPGHGPVLHDQTYVLLLHDLLQSALSQLNAYLAKTSPAMSQSLDKVSPAVDLSPFRQRFTGGDEALGAAFDRMAANVVKLLFYEASLN